MVVLTVAQTIRFRTTRQDKQAFFNNVNTCLDILQSQQDLGLPTLSCSEVETNEAGHEPRAETKAPTEESPPRSGRLIGLIGKAGPHDKARQTQARATKAIPTNQAQPTFTRARATHSEMSGLDEMWTWKRLLTRAD